MFATGDNDAHHRRGLSDIRQRDQRPYRRAAHALNHLHVDGKRSLMHAGDHQRGVQEAEQRRADRGKTTGQQMTDRKRDTIADHAAKRTDKGVRKEYRKDQRAHRDDHQIQIIRHDALHARFNKPERQPGQQRRNNLRLVAHFLNAEQTEVPHLRHLLTEQIGVHQLR